MGVVDVKEKHEDRLIGISGVVGVSADVDRNVIVVYVESSDVCNNVPNTLEGYDVECEVSGQVEPLAKSTIR